MNQRTWILFLLLLLVAATPVFADLAQATSTTVEGAVGLPTSLVKLVGGLVWTVGEVIILPFRALSSAF